MNLLEATKILSPFCLPPDVWLGRYSLELVVVRSGAAYATDGRWLVCLPAPGEPDTKTETPFPDLSSFADILLREYTKPMDDLVLPSLGCEECNDTGLVVCKCEDGKCSRCEGEGETTCSECEQDRECPDCDGTGKCPDCEGKMTAKCEACDKARIDIEGSDFSLLRIKKIKTLGDVKYAKPEGENGSMLPFSFAGGEGHGVLMGMRK